MRSKTRRENFFAAHADKIVANWKTAFLFWWKIWQNSCSGPQLIGVELDCNCSSFFLIVNEKNCSYPSQIRFLVLLACVTFEFETEVHSWNRRRWIRGEWRIFSVARGFSCVRLLWQHGYFPTISCFTEEFIYIKKRTIIAMRSEMRTRRRGICVNIKWGINFAPDSRWFFQFPRIQSAPQVNKSVMLRGQDSRKPLPQKVISINRTKIRCSSKGRKANESQWGFWDSLLLFFIPMKKSDGVTLFSCLVFWTIWTYNGTSLPQWAAVWGCCGISPSQLSECPNMARFVPLNWML